MGGRELVSRKDANECGRGVVVGSRDPRSGLVVDVVVAVVVVVVDVDVPREH